DARGSFTLLGVAPGQYQLIAANRPAAGARGLGGGRAAGPAAAAPMAWGNTAVGVSNADVQGIALALRPGLEVRGRMVFDGTSAPLTPEQLRQRMMRVQPVGGRGAAAGAAGTGTINPDGTFAITGALPGRYAIITPDWPAGKWRVKSLSADGRDVSDVPIELSSTDLANVVVTFTERPAQGSGIVHTPRAGADPNAFVVMFPADSRAWGWPTSLHLATARTTSTGAFTISSLAPGDYIVAAISDDAAANWQDPKVLQTLSA